MMSRLATLALLATAGFAQEGDTWEWAAYGSGPQSDIVNSGEVHYCKQQPPATGGIDTCTSNLDCGTALCINAVPPGEVVARNVCGCGNFERRFNGEQITVCSCKHSTSENSCLPIWQESIMCKFACKNCYSCEEKNPTECNNDPLCTQLQSGDCELAPVQTCVDNAASKTTCEEATECRWFENDTEGIEECKSRMYAPFPAEDDANAKCPIGTERMVDAYIGDPGNFFDTCVPDDLKISDCKYYEWDGDSCKKCEPTFRLGMVALKEGNGRIKQNAICVLKNNDNNDYCEVFVHAEGGARTGGVLHHKCARCKPGYEWPIDSTGQVDQHKCEQEYVENSYVVMVDSRVLVGALTAVGTFLIFTLGRMSMQYMGKKNDVETQM